MLRSRLPHDMLELAGIVGLFTYCFGILLNRNFNTAAVPMMAIPFMFRPRPRWREFLRDPLVVASGVFFLFLTVRTGFAAVEFGPPQWNDLLGGALKLFGSGFLLVYLVAYWLRKARARWDLLLVVFSAGFVLQILRKIDWANLAALTAKLQVGVERATFGYSANRLGLFSAILLLACVFLHRSLWGPRDRARRWVRVGYWVFLSMLSSACLVYSQSRSAWAAAVLVVPAALVLDAYMARRSGRLRYAPVLLVAALLTAGFCSFNLAQISTQRLATGLEGRSVSDRLSIYEIALDNWKENPLVGRGPGTSGIMIQSADSRYDDVKAFDHLHNIFIDIGAQIGVIGLLLFGWSGLIILRQALCPADPESRRFNLFALGSMAMVLITGMVNQPLHSPHGVYLVGYLGGICYSSRFVVDSATK